MSGDFNGRVALVTGGSRGIGKETALQLARGGADVAIGYASRGDTAGEVATAIESSGRRALAMRCDVTKQNEIDAFVAATRDQLGPIDLLAHCGAISNVADHSDLTFERWQETIDANLHGAFRVVFAVKDEMIAQGSGSIVLISSVAALRPRARQIHYSASKAGVIAMARCCAEAFAPGNVRVNCVAPGLIDTEMARVLGEEQIRAVEAGTPMGRMGRPDEIAEVVCFLLSERSSFMTGQVVVASGGRVTLP